jgi:hypothetical protein
MDRSIAIKRHEAAVGVFRDLNRYFMEHHRFRLLVHPVEVNGAFYYEVFPEAVGDGIRISVPRTVDFVLARNRIEEVMTEDEEGKVRRLWAYRGKV